MKRLLIALSIGICAFGAIEAAFTRGAACLLRGLRKHKIAAAGMVLAGGIGSGKIATSEMRSRTNIPCPDALRFTTDEKVI